MAGAHKEQRFFNRELSWVEFNRRVLDEARDSRVPLLERLKFIAIVASNFDEFFMVRVASLKAQLRAGIFNTCPSELSTEQQLNQVRTEARHMIDEQYRLLNEELFPHMETHGLTRRNPDQWNHEQRAFLRNYYNNEIFHLLSPINISKRDNVSLAGNKMLLIGYHLQPNGNAAAQYILPLDNEPSIQLVPVPANLDRVIFLPSPDESVPFCFLEEVISEFGSDLFPGYSIKDTCSLRLLRDADFAVDESRDEDFVEAMSKVLEGREHSDVVRLSIQGGKRRLRDEIFRVFDVDAEDVFDVPGALDLSKLMSLAFARGFDHLRDSQWGSIDLHVPEENESMFDLIEREPILLHHPFESFNPVIRLIQEAAHDPEVLAIKMTLYRTSGNSPIVKALSEAAKSGKQVTAFVELKARFDEGQNIQWASHLEKAGVIVIYGLAQLKVHAKAMLIVRRGPKGLKRFYHLGTGNYNEKTSKLYTDMGLLGCEDSIAYEMGLMFNAISGYGAIPTLNKISMAPTGLKQRVLNMIDREIHKSTKENPGRIVAKFNALADTDVIEALYRASSSHVKVELNIRGICMLVPGVKGLSENIRVTSTIDRYLEHSRIFYFFNGGDEEVYCSSADWMPRNLEKRVELLFPLEHPEHKKRTIEMLEVCIGDNSKTSVLKGDGTYTRVSVPKGEKALRSQEYFFNQYGAQVKERDKSNANKKEFTVRRKPPKA